jgi:UrcA family protein
MKWVVATSVVLALSVLGWANAQESTTTEVVITGHKAAAPGSEVMTKTVRYSDLDISKSAGLNTLLVRIRGAASDVCAPQPQASDLTGTTDYKKCISDAVGTAVAKVNNPGLKALVANAGH